MLSPFLSLETCAWCCQVKQRLASFVQVTNRENVKAMHYWPFCDSIVSVGCPSEMACYADNDSMLRRVMSLLERTSKCVAFITYQDICEKRVCKVTVYIHFPNVIEPKCTFATLHTVTKSLFLYQQLNRGNIKFYLRARIFSVSLHAGHVLHRVCNVINSKLFFFYFICINISSTDGPLRKDGSFVSKYCMFVANCRGCSRS